MLTINEDGIELYGEDHIGVRHGFSTLVQILRIFRECSEVLVYFVILLEDYLFPFHQYFL